MTPYRRTEPWRGTERERVSAAPAVFLIIPTEGRVRVEDDCLNDAERDALKAWLRSRPGYDDLVRAAVRLVNQEAA